MTETDSKNIDPYLRRRLAEHVRRLRLEKGISQESLSVECGFHRTYVSHIERAVTNITLDNLQKLALGLGVDPSELLAH
ncbi:transcriptional regulator [Burkholderia ubonensis]|uniref:helix-turn-helix domain-containing protein n=1 Tax=Burkholderia ubonensis TaxID=101571 RepID=UPI0007531CC1|nr:helix-turn-helix transcriptional regulator [Burkholderia ubonensis]KVM80473.1 transcriptional regulator [Burkholderia ubonensis]KVU94467.1 transcriptional regulator [Burkholderia ubonensis]KVV08714.1 transcriptional regulator [Burkholderia ubonensis]OJA58385.1 transcriptional regulator [Burkholderia ubonensis]OJA62996.1 transcriptional regulator [Burkholderia ubonensis]